MKRAILLLALFVVTFGVVGAYAEETKVSTVTLSISGMHCEGCAAGITAILKRTEGVLKADVSFAEERATVDFDPTKTSSAKIVQAVEKMGYKATPKAK